MSSWKQFITKLFVTFLFVFSFSICANDSVKKHWIPGWQSTNPMTIARAGAAIVHYKNTVYVFGGVDGVNFLSSVESATINPDGSLSPWQLISEMPEPRGFMSATVYAGRVYVVGGGNGPYGKHLLSSIVSAPVLDDGKLGPWRTETESMLTPRRCSKLVVHNNTLHVFGGFGGALLDTVESSRFSDNGKLSSWFMQPNKMTMPRYVNEVKRVSDKVVVIGGHHPTKGRGISDVEYANLNENPMRWRPAKPMITGRYAFSSNYHGQFLYAMGGISGTEYLNSIEKLPIANQLSESTWRNSTKLPAFMANFTTMVIGDYVYVFGGSTRYGYLSKVWFARFNASGDIGYYGSEADLAAFKSSAQVKKTVTNLPNSGTVLESIATEGYTYLRVLSKGKQMWLAAPKMEITPNKKVHFSEGVYMSNFFSKTLGRNFPAILFVGTVKVD